MEGWQEKRKKNTSIRTPSFPQRKTGVLIDIGGLLTPYGKVNSSHASDRASISLGHRRWSWQWERGLGGSGGGWRWQKFEQSRKGKKHCCPRKWKNKLIWWTVGFTGSRRGPFQLDSKEVLVVRTCLVESLPPARFISSSTGTEKTENTTRQYDSQQVD